QPNGVTLDLPGPTGERNRLSFSPRGAVLCVATSTKALLNQLAASMATGNHALVLAGGQLQIPDDLPPELKDRIRFIGAQEVAQYAFQVALIETGAKALRTELAARPG